MFNSTKTFGSSQNHRKFFAAKISVRPGNLCKFGDCPSNLQSTLETCGNLRQKKCLDGIKISSRRISFWETRVWGFFGGCMFVFHATLSVPTLGSNIVSPHLHTQLSFERRVMKSLFDRMQIFFIYTLNTYIQSSINLIKKKTPLLTSCTHQVSRNKSSPISKILSTDLKIGPFAHSTLPMPCHQQIAQA